MDKLQQLYDRLDAGLQGHLSAWGKLPPGELITQSREITAIRDAHEYLAETHDFEPKEVDYLLSLPDPLQTVGDKWMERMGDLSDFCFALDEVFQGMEGQRREPPVEKPSVLDKLKDKAALPAQPKPHPPAKGGMNGKGGTVL